MQTDNFGDETPKHRVIERIEGVPFYQGNAPMAAGCICDPMDYAALGHMTTCPLFGVARTFEAIGPENLKDAI